MADEDAACNIEEGEEMEIQPDIVVNMECNDIGNRLNENSSSAAPSVVPPGQFILVNQSGQLITAEELSAAINQQMQLFSMENQMPIDCKSTSDLEELSQPSTSKITTEQTVEDFLSSIQTEIVSRLDQIDGKISKLKTHCESLEKKIDITAEKVKEKTTISGVVYPTGKKRPGTIVVGLKPNESSMDEALPPVVKKRLPWSEVEDFPNGSWLGDPNNPDKRVRCHVSETDLADLNHSRSPEKLALTLLDYLFDRETQAKSNISGTGRHGKKQLDPRKIFGIRCHVEERYPSFDEKDWRRIKLNIDSKCRTAFRRKQKGMPLAVKAFSSKSHSRIKHFITSHTQQRIGGLDDDDDSFSMSCIKMDNLKEEEEDELGDSGAAVPITIRAADGLFPQRIFSKIHSSESGDIQVVQATAEQLVQIQQTHQIQILSGSNLSQALQEHFLKEDSNETS